MSAMAWMAGQIAAMPPLRANEIVMSPAIREIVALARKHGQITTKIVMSERGIGHKSAHGLLTRAYQLGMLKRIEPGVTGVPILYEAAQK